MTQAHSFTLVYKLNVEGCRDGSEQHKYWRDVGGMVVPKNHKKSIHAKAEDDGMQ